MRIKCQPAPRRRLPNSGLRRLVQWLLGLAVLAWAGAAAAATYVDDSLPDVKPEDRVVVAHPQPVQLLFKFETKGAPNDRATKIVKPTAVDAVKASGLFSEVSDGPTANGAVLSIVVDNVVDPKELQAAEGKGFVTGLTFFVAGSNVKDHYVCTIDYVSGPAAPKITRTAHHGVTTQMGMINSPPPNSVKIGSIKDAVFTMVRQIISNPLNDLARDPAFQGLPPAPPAPPESAAPAATTATTVPTAPATPTAPPAPTVPTAAPPAPLSPPPAPPAPETPAPDHP